MGCALGVLACATARARPRRIFVEPFPRGLARYAHPPERLRHVLLKLAYASKAEMTARLAHWLGYLTSPDTLLRRQRAEPIILPAPRVLEVDEFALRRAPLRPLGTPCRRPAAARIV